MENKMKEDSFYIGQFLGGEQEGFEMLVRKYQNKALNIVYSLIGMDRESEDIVQEVFIKVYHNLKSFRQQSGFSTWLYRITVNTVYDFLRRRKNLVIDEALVERSASVYPGPEDALLSKERQDFIQQAISRIPLKYRAAFVLKEIEDLTYSQIAEVLKCRVGTVESRIYRARQFLKEYLINSGRELA